MKNLFLFNFLFILFDSLNLTKIKEENDFELSLESIKDTEAFSLGFVKIKIKKLNNFLCFENFNQNSLNLFCEKMGYDSFISFSNIGFNPKFKRKNCFLYLSRSECCEK